MKEFITEHVVANTIRMKRSIFKGTFLIVEGDSDKKVYDNFINREECHIEIGHGKDNSIKAMKILESSSVKGVLAIIDADFWILDKNKIDSNNVMITDSHDIETMIIQSPVLDRFIVEFCSDSKINALKDNIRDILLRTCIPLGYLRWLSLKDSLNLKFEEMSFNKFIDKETLVTNIPNMVKEIKNHSQLHTLDETQVIEKLYKLMDIKHDPWQICCGHDLVNVLSIGLRKMFATYNTNTVEPYMIEKIIRTAYSYSYFCNSILYRNIKSWEDAHNSYKVLADVG